MIRVVAETLELAGLRDFNVGGTVHVVVCLSMWSSIEEYMSSLPLFALALCVVL